MTNDSLPYPGPPLVEPYEPTTNGGHDNDKFELIVYQGMEIINSKNHCYRADQNLGRGQSGMVFKVTLLSSDKQEMGEYALKVSNSDLPSVKRIEYECKVLEFLKKNCIHVDKSHFFQYEETFLYHGHRCLIMEYLGQSLLDILDQNRHIGLNFGFIQKVMRSILQTLVIFEQLNIIHCDIKPENILQSRHNTDEFKIIDFGLCSVVNEITNHHIQSRYYRAPEVVLDMPFDCKADIWSAGCVAAEMFLGFPILPACCEVHLLYLIDQMVGPFQKSFIEKVHNPFQFFTQSYKLKSVRVLNQYAKENFEEGHPWFISKSLRDNIMLYRSTESGNNEIDSECNIPNKQITEGLSEQEISNRNIFIDFVLLMLQIDPDDRPNADILLDHPFMLTDFD